MISHGGNLKPDPFPSRQDPAGELAQDIAANRKLEQGPTERPETRISPSADESLFQHASFAHILGPLRRKRQIKTAGTLQASSKRSALPAREKIARSGSPRCGSMHSMISRP